MKIYNSLTNKKEVFLPLNPSKTGLYTCGPTVYDYAHIGHGRKYVNDDILRRVLIFLGFKVTHVQNVTDVGHLESDADEGEDKLEKGAKKTGKTVWEVADFYTKYFYRSMDKLNILRPNIIAKATEHIKEQISLITKLVKKGYAYETKEAVYFNISKFPDYGKLFSQELKDKKIAAREDIKTGKHKKNPADFVLWFKTVGRFKNHALRWSSPWGEGFPGWHIECSAMSMKYLKTPIDIHTGGIDHLPIHHPNEIAQSEAAFGKQFVRFWIHWEFLLINGKKMSKSLDNFYRVEDIEKKGFDSLDLRYLYLTVHYRKQLNFTWEGLSSAHSALSNLKSQILNLKTTTQISKRTILSEEKLKKIDLLREKFIDVISDDLNMPKALAVVWEVIKSNIPSQDKYDLIIEFDKVLGLDLKDLSKIRFIDKKRISNKVKELVKKREASRKAKKWKEADNIRQQITKMGYKIEDRGEKTKIITKNIFQQ